MNKAKNSNNKTKSKADSDSIDAEIKTNGSSYTITFVFLAVSILAGVYIYYQQILNDFKSENSSISVHIDTLKKLEETANENIRLRKEKIAKSSPEVDSSIVADKEEEKDYSYDNEEQIKLISEKIKVLDNNYSTFEKEAISTIISKSKNDFTNHIKKLQSDINKTYVDKIKKKKQEESNSNFKYYHRYNDTDIHKIKSLYNPYDDNFHDTRTKYMNDAYSKLIKSIEALEKSKSAYLNKINTLEKELKALEEKFKNHDANISDKSKELLTKDSKSSSKDKGSLISLINKMKESRIKIKAVLKEALGYSFEYKPYYDALYEALGKKNFNSEIVFKSNRYDTYEDMIKVIKDLKGKKNLMFLVHTNQDRLIGAYMENPFPDLESLEQAKYYNFDDKKAILFDFKGKDDFYAIHQAISYARYHITFYTYQDLYKICFGSCLPSTGFEFNIAPIKNTNPNEIVEGKIIHVDSGAHPRNYKVDKFSEIAKEVSNMAHLEYKFIKIIEIKFIEEL